MNLQVIRTLQNMIIMMVGRCVMRAVTDNQGLQKVQVQGLPTEVLDGIDRMQNYGVTSHPLEGAQGIMVSVGGSRDNAVVIAMDDRRYRLELQPGEVSVYDDQGQKVHLTRAGIVVDGAGKPVNFVNCPDVHMDGNLHVAGDVNDHTSTMQSMRDTYNGHNHPENDSGGPTDAPNQEMS